MKILHLLTLFSFFLFAPLTSYAVASDFESSDSSIQNLIDDDLQKSLKVDFSFLTFDFVFLKTDISLISFAKVLNTFIDKFLTPLFTFLFPHSSQGPPVKKL